MTSSPWDNDPILVPAPQRQETAGGGAGGNPWDSDPIIAPPEDSGFDTDRFSMEKGRSDLRPRMGKQLVEKAKEIKRGGRKGPGKAESALMGFVDWAGMGFGDEAVAGLQTGMDYLDGSLGDEGFGDRFTKRQKAYQDRSDDAWEDHPWLYGAGAVPGFLASTVLTPTIRGATGLATGAKTGALWGAVSGFGDGDGAGLNLGSRAKNAITGGAIGGAGGAAIGKAGDMISNAITDRAMQDLAEEASTAAARRDASRFGLDESMTRGQLTGNVYEQATEDMMRKTGYGDEAARIAAKQGERQAGDVATAADDINGRLAGTAPRIDHPTEAAELLHRDISAAADSAQRQMGAGNAADEMLARTAADTIETGVAGGAQKLAPDATDYDLGSAVGQGVQARQRASAAARDAAYETAGQAQGVIERQGVEGMADRIMENLTYGRQQPVIVNDRTPAARDALAYLSDVQNFSRPTNKADPLAGTVDPSSIVGITPQGIEQVRKTLVALSQQANAAARAGDATDKFAMRAIMDEFDQQLERIVRYGMFDGDQNWLDLYKHARGLHAKHRATYRPDDQLKTAMRDIVERDADPSQVANYLYGRNKVGDTRLSRDLAAHLKETLGEGSDEWGAIKQHGWQRLVHGPAAGVEGKTRQITHETAQAIAADIDEFLSNRGRGLAETLYSEPEREIMRRYAQNLRNLATSRRTPSAALEHMIELADPNRRLQVTELARMMTGGENVALNSPVAGRLADTLIDVFGRDSEQVSLVRQAVWKQISENAEGKNPKGYGVIANNIAELVNGKGRPVAEKLFEPEQLQEMAAFARTLRRIAGNPNARNHSNTASGLVRWFRENNRRIMAGIGALSGGIDGGVTGFVAGQGIKYVDDSVSGLRAQRLFGGQRDLSVSRTIRAGAEKIGRSATRKGLKATGPSSGLIGTRAVEQMVPALAGEGEED